MRQFGRLIRGVCSGFGLCVVAVGLLAFSPAMGQTIIDEWSQVKPPAPPELKPVTIDPKTTALLVLDFTGAQDPTKGPCNKNARPRCIASLPKIKQLLADARASETLVVYSLAGAATVADIATDIAPHASDPVVKSGPDKFVGTDLEKILAGKGIKTVIVTGTTAEGAVLDTATDAALKGMNVIVPVDGMSAADLYPEQYVAWHLSHAPGVAARVTLTDVAMMKF